MEKKSSSKQVLLSVLAVAILVVAVVGVSFAFFTYSKQGETVNTITTGTLVFSYNEPENGILLEDAVPMSDEDAKTTLTSGRNVFDFTVTSTINGNATINYEITAKESTDQSDIGTLESKYVKVSLDKVAGGSETPVKAATYYDDLTAGTIATGDKLLGTGSATNSNGSPVTTTYRLRMWMAEQDADGTLVEMKDDKCFTTANAPVSCDAEGEVDSSKTVRGTNGKTFSIKINVNAKDAAA